MALISIRDSEGSVISSENPLNFGAINKGGVVQASVWIWNDYGDEHVGEVLEDGVQVRAIPSPEDPGEILTGTVYSGNVSLLEARSCAAIGVIADDQSEWTPINPFTGLITGRLPSGAGREVQLRIVVPIDAEAMTEKRFSIVASEV